jgi:hypothetical protein
MVERISKIDQYKKSLAIDEDDLDRAVVEQPSLFFNVADELALAISERDGLKLELEEFTAEKYKQFRSEALATEEKFTETSLERKITLDKEIMSLQREYADKKLSVDRLTALRDSFRDRSKMLEQAVSLYCSKLYNLQIERGARSTRRNLVDAKAENNSAKASEMRRERLEQMRARTEAGE